jgi:uncharacterized protein (TIGR04141 family)
MPRKRTDNDDKTHHLNIYRLKDEAPELKDISADIYFPDYKIENENMGGAYQFKLFIKRNAQHPPSWCDLLRPILKNANNILANSPGFIYLVKNGISQYAMTGGFGHAKIKSLIDKDYGLHMALRIIHPDTINSVTQKALKGSTRQIYRAVVSYRPNLDLDNFNRFLKSVTGKSIDPNLGASVAGKTCLSIDTKTRLENIQKFFDQLEAIYKREPLTKFPKSYSAVTDLNEIQELEQELVKELASFVKDGRDRERLYLELDDLLTQFQCTKFAVKIGREETEIPYFNLESIRSVLTQKGIIIRDMRDIAKIKINGYNQDRRIIVEQEPLFDILVYEIDHKGSSYILFDKKWFKIYDDFKRHIDSQIQTIRIHQNLMPDWNLKTLPEEKNYNEFVSKATKWENLDRDLVSIPGLSNIEICDLYNPKGRQFIHVKRTWGSKATYLFSQGFVSGESLYISADFRKACHKKWKKLFNPEYQRGAEIIYAIADNNAFHEDFPKNLSFFAKLGLAQNTQHLRSMGYEVSLSPIRIKGESH